MPIPQPFQPNPAIAAAKQKIQTFIDTQADGQTLSWVEIEQGTGVPMPARVAKGQINGRDLVRRVIREAGRLYAPVHGMGIELSSPTNTKGIIAAEIQSAGRKLLRASADSATGLTRHGPQMTVQDKDALTRTSGLVTTLAMQARVGVKTLTK
jgi:hypothetical protein